MTTTFCRCQSSPSLHLHFHFVTNSHYTDCPTAWLLIWFTFEVSWTLTWCGLCTPLYIFEMMIRARWFLWSNIKSFIVLKATYPWWSYYWLITIYCLLHVMIVSSPVLPSASLAMCPKFFSFSHLNYPKCLMTCHLYSIKKWMIIIDI